MLKRLFVGLAAWTLCTGFSGAREYNGIYSSGETDYIAFPIGGIGTGMYCIEGTGAISHMSPRTLPDLFREPCCFAALCVKGMEDGTRVLESQVPAYKAWGRGNCGSGLGGTTYGLPRFDKGNFLARFPFAQLQLWEDEFPVRVKIAAWSPFIPNNADDSSLPVGCLEYTFLNTTNRPLQTVFSFNTKNFMERTSEKSISPMQNGFVLNNEAAENAPWQEGHFAIYTDNDATTTDLCWFRGGWFDPLTMAWNHAASGETFSQGPQKDTEGASLYVPLTIEANGSRTLKLYTVWYCPKANIRAGEEAVSEADYGPRYDKSRLDSTPFWYEPFYSHRFASLEKVVDYWTENYDRLRKETKTFTDAFYDNTLPPEVTEAVSANLTILKSTTVLRQHDGTFCGWEGSGDSWGSCHGTTTHVWNYTQALPHLFPALQRTMHDTEFIVDQNEEGHQTYRSCFPIRPTGHSFYAACDGQLGGLVRLYREWRISGDTEWMKSLYPLAQKSLDYCIRTWDPHEVGALMEPHHNTYDIEFWGADPMCTSFYAAGLNAFIQMSKYLKKDCKRYEKLLRKVNAYVDEHLWNGEYYYQQVQTEGLDAPDPKNMTMGFHTNYSPEALAIFEKEGPKYQYGTGCLSDGVIGCWASLAAGLEEPFSHEKVVSHLKAVYSHNLLRNFKKHSNPQRPSYALGKDGGLLLCSWPRGGKPQLPFIYSDEAWTGIEYQVAAHLCFEGLVEEGLDIVRAVRKRYDGSMRNPFNEYECGNWYARALSGYSLLQALTGVRYDAVEKTLYIDSHIGNSFRSFLCTESGFGVAGLKDGQPFLDVRSGNIEVKKYVVSPKKK